MIEISTNNKLFIFFFSLLITSCNNDKSNSVLYNVDYYADSTIKNQGFYLNNMKHGYFTFYNKAGMLETEGVYTNGKRNGAWKYYDLKGLYKIAEFKNGDLKKIKYYKNGKIVQVRKVNNDEIIEEKYYYYDNGELVDSIWYPINSVYVGIVDEK